ncbi:flagellar filament capping protein FliD [Paenibacillus koleovorans]|uniref:flagellar filament capping protein FliD n=1 Tax=Paenibacillus koleovorans TaxID=121608 RepID=UPI000FD94265|nr:flagellar filament capping protein FliD [Paenibacillus koleovorans]
MVTRIGGLATGMDIDTMVLKLMQAERAPLDKLNQQKQSIEWKRDSYREVYSQFLTFRNSAFDMKLQSSYLAKQATSDDETAVYASATAAAVEGNHEIKVTQLAKSAMLNSGSALGVNNRSATMSQLGLAAESTLTVAGERGVTAIQVKPTDKISDVVANINNKARLTGVTASYDETLDRFFFNNALTGADSKIEIKSTNAALLDTVMKLPGSASQTGKGQTITMGRAYAGGLLDRVLTKPEGSTSPLPDQKLRLVHDNMTYDFVIKESTSIGDLIDSINSSDLGKLGVSAQLNSDNKLVIFNPDDDKPIEFQEISSGPQLDDVDLLVDLGVLTSSGTSAITSVSNQDYSKITVNGINANIEYNGIPVSYKTNSFEINGVSFTARNLTSQAVKISVANDTDKVFANIKSFVDSYNALVESVNKKTSEARFRDFLPLTAEQRKDMKEDEIKRWEEKAKSGLLKSDTILTGALQNMRNSLNNAIGGLPANSLNQLLQIGIKTGNYMEQGKLYIDETKLRKAIAEQPDQVMAMFTADDKDRNTDRADGLAVRMYDQAERIMNQLKETAGTSLSGPTDYLQGKELQRLEDRIKAMTTRLTAVEDRYYRQFTAMEKYINQLNSQSAWLAQQFSTKQ